MGTENEIPNETNTLTEYRFGRSAMVVFNNLNSVLRKYHLVLLVTWDFSKFGCLIFKSATAQDLRLQGSELLPPSKKKDTTFVVSFFLGAAPFGISMLCRSKPSLRNCLVLRTCEFTAHQRRRSEDRSDISIAQILTVPSTSEQVLYRLLRLIL